jgi:hypothetical protein
MGTFWNHLKFKYKIPADFRGFLGSRPQSQGIIKMQPASRASVRQEDMMQTTGSAAFGATAGASSLKGKL